MFDTFLKSFIYNSLIFSRYDVGNVAKISADRSGHAQQQQQGIIRCRAGVGEQGKPRGDGKPGGPDVPP